MLLKVLISAAASAVIALAMGAYLRWLHRRYVTPLNFPNMELACEVEQVRIVHIDCAPDKAVQLARNALFTVPNVKNVASAGRNIKAKTRVTFRTFGENISIVAAPSGTDSSELTIESKPRFSGTTVDYGKSYENVERIVAKLASSQTLRLLSANNSFKPNPLRSGNGVAG